MLMNQDLIQIRVPLIKAKTGTALEADSLKTILEFSPARDTLENLSAVILSKEGGSTMKSSIITIYQVINQNVIQEIAVNDKMVYLYDKDKSSLLSQAGRVLISLKEPLPRDVYQRQQQLDQQLSKINISAHYQRIQNIYYDYNKDYIRNDASAILDHLVHLMQDYPELSIRLTSHTDSRGSVVYNQTLSKRRADSAKTYLINEGIESSRIEVNWFGEENLVNECENNKNCDEERHQSNRRTEITILFK
jgi:outer membrane protein OmpA-like peptidoglycan-associated protein